MTDAERVNAVLEKVGSSYRTFPGDMVNASLVALFEAIPAYVDQQVKERLEAMTVSLPTVSPNSENTNG